MNEKHDELMREAEKLLRRATEDALARTTVLLQMIADGTAEPTAATVATRDLTRLLDAVREAEAVGRAVRECVQTPSRRVH